MSNVEQTEIQYNRDHAAEVALRSIERLRESLDQAEQEIKQGSGGNAMRPDFCIPSHQHMQEVVTNAATFVAYWQASGMEGRS